MTDGVLDTRATGSKIHHVERRTKCLASQSRHHCLTEVCPAVGTEGRIPRCHPVPAGVAATPYEDTAIGATRSRFGLHVWLFFSEFVPSERSHNAICEPIEI